MLLIEKYLTILAKLGLTTGAVGLSAMLGALVPAAASEPPPGSNLSFAPGDSVSERLAAVRVAVSTLGATSGDVRSACWGNVPGTHCAPAPWANWHNWGNAHIWPNVGVFNHWHNR